MEALPDDPYRSLAAFVRDGYGYEKATTLFAEFAWAEFFRPTVRIERTKKGWKKAVKVATRLARSTKAENLPGHCGEQCVR